ncbi:MAG: dihydrodipicolinate synthase family protein [bacterium]|jgi:4-hydroxy-tetrahydrodipicolinate synthase|nr:dihydrodipicolinate synthase family protein [bacterium]
MIELPRGVWPVMLTPFTSDGAVDWEALDVLTDWYIESGVAGLFAVCASSEMYHLTEGERFAMARRVVRKANGRVPVVASGTFGGSVDLQAETVVKTAETGVAAVVALVCQMVHKEASDADWQREMDGLLKLTGDIPLGLYECPSPYHRLLSPELLAWCAATDRFCFLKDTSCDMDLIWPKLDVIQSKSLRFFNANTPTLLDSLLAGGDGYCGTAANFFPDLFVWICHYFEAEPDLAADVQRFLTVADKAAGHKYRASAKWYLSKLGLPILPICRDKDTPFNAEDHLTLQHLLELAETQRSMLGLV